MCYRFAQAQQTFNRPMPAAHKAAGIRACQGRNGGAVATDEWGGRRATEALNRVRAEGARRSSPCVICDGVIDYSLRYPNLWSCSVQHVISRNLRPDLTWDPSNWAPAHLTCNREVGDGTITNPYDLGVVG